MRRTDGRMRRRISDKEIRIVEKEGQMEGRKVRTMEKKEKLA